MKFFYTIGIYITDLVLQVVALFNQKIRLGVNGRKHTFDILESSISKDDMVIWMHCASLGEYEQGLPVLKALKIKYTDYKTVVSFFSPSGYEVKKDSNDIDTAVYIPLDTPKNAKRFLNLVNPKLIVFVKYDIWPNILLEAKKRQLKSILISATFRPQQPYFKWYGKLMRKALFTFEHIFTQDENSKQLIESIGYNSVSVSGDTRFDRVSSQLKMNNTVSFIKDFIEDKTTIVFGSSWPADDSLFIPFINSNTHKNVKYIIAPHTIKDSYIDTLVNQIDLKVIRFSEMQGKSLSDYNVFILDTIGYLSRVYSYADIVYIGGGAGHTGLHNILEPAVFGTPILIGKNYKKFPEAKALIDLKGVLSVTNAKDMGLNLQKLINSKETRQEIGQINYNYIKKNTGAVDQILDYTRI